MMEKSKIENIWIEAEEWSGGQWNFENDNTDVIVTLTNGEKYVGSFFTYLNIQELTTKKQKNWWKPEWKVLVVKWHDSDW